MSKPKPRHKPINGRCYVYERITKDVYVGPCTDPAHQEEAKKKLQAARAKASEPFTQGGYDERFENGRKRLLESKLASGEIEPGSVLGYQGRPKRSKC